MHDYNPFCFDDSVFKKCNHTPLHIFTPNSKYSLTASTYRNIKWLKSTEAKRYLLNSIRIGFGKYEWTIEEWVILDNHYHLLLQAPQDALTLPNIIRDIHRFTALWIKKNVPAARWAKRIWFNYWDKCLTYEKAYFTRINYIWRNPVKHGYVKDPAEWEFGSYFERIKSEKETCYYIGNNFSCDRVKEKDDF